MSRDVEAVVYSMGRVGSVSTLRTMEKAGISSWHCHYLVSQEREPNYGDARLPEFYKQIHPEKDIKIVTLIRDPIARSLSSWLRQKQEYELLDMTTEDAVRKFMHSDTIKWSFNWWHLEFNQWAQINFLDEVAKSTFSEVGHFELPYKIKDRFRILLLRTEQLKYNHKALSEFLEAPVDVQHINTTEGRGRGYASEYKRLTTSMKFWKGFVDAVYQHPVVLSTFNRENINTLRKRWTYHYA